MRAASPGPLGSDHLERADGNVAVSDAVQRRLDRDDRRQVTTADSVSGLCTGRRHGSDAIPRRFSTCRRQGSCDFAGRDSNAIFTTEKLDKIENRTAGPDEQRPAVGGR